MQQFYKTTLLLTALLGILSINPANAYRISQKSDLTNYRYRIDTPSVFHNRQAVETEKINRLIEDKKNLRKTSKIENPSPIHQLAPSNAVGNIDAPNGELWYYTGDFDYIEIPPHEDVQFTDKILQEYSFNIYNSKMELIGTIKDRMDYREDEVRVPLCEITPVATRNFFNTDDKIEIIVSLAVNIEGGGNNYRSLVYSLGNEKDDEGFDQPIMVYDDLVSDVIEGPSTDGNDNFYISFMKDIYDELDDDCTFWDFLLSQKAGIEIYGKATDDKGPRLLYETVLPLIQFPGDQQDVPPMMSLINGNDVIYCLSYYKEPFYNRYDDPLNDDMTQREGNSLIIELYKANEGGLSKFSATEIPISLDPMNDSEGNPTCLFSYYSVGSMLYSGDILFDAPGATSEKPYFIITRGNYQVSTDGITNSYFTYTNAGSLDHTLFLYADGTSSMGNLKGFSPQQMFVSTDSYGYVYNFIDIYTGETAAVIDADYYYDDDSDSELLTANMARYAVDDTYRYVFELRYPLVDDNENDILRFMHIDKDGKYNHTDFVNMGKGVEYAQSLLSTEAVAPHAYSTSDTPTYMFLLKRGVEGMTEKQEELVVAEAESENNPEGKMLLQLGSGQYGSLASIVPEFPEGNNPGRLFIYYYDSGISKYALDIYALPIESDDTEVETIFKDEQWTTGSNDFTIYGLDGRIIACGKGTVNISDLASGVYIVRRNGKSYKVIK